MIIIWSKENCAYCMEAKVLLTRKGIAFEERMIGDGWTREQLLEVAPHARSVPQIFEGEKLIGGYNELFNYLKLKVI
jgi:glutaredoxin 3